MPSGDWYCQIDGTVDGPYSFDELIYLVRRKQLAQTDQVRRGEEGSWTFAGQITGLFVNSPNLTAQQGTLTTKQEEPTEDTDLEPLESDSPELNDSGDEVSEIPNPPPPPVLDDDTSVGKIIAIGAVSILLLLLLLLPLLFLQGDDSKRVAQGDRGNNSDASSSSSEGKNQGGGNGTANTNNETGSQETSSSNQESTSPDGNTDKPADSPEAQGRQEAEFLHQKQGKQNSASSEKEKNAAATERKPIPIAVNAIAYDPEPQTTPPQASSAKNQGRLGGNKGGDGREGVFFGVKAKGQHFVYIVDCSGSMAGGPLARVCEELISSINKLTTKQSFYVFFFNDWSIPMFGQPNKTMLHATPKNIHQLESWVSNVRSGGGTDPTNALVEALKMEPRPDAIFLLTDGEIPDQIPELLRAANRRQAPSTSRINSTQAPSQKKIPINTIGFENTSGEFILKQIATENNGEYRFIPSGLNSMPTHPNFPSMPTHP